MKLNKFVDNNLNKLKFLGIAVFVVLTLTGLASFFTNLSFESFFKMSVAVIGVAFSLVFLIVKTTIKESFSPTRSKIDSPDKIKFETLFKNAREGVVIHSPDFKILSINPAAEKIFNLKSKEVIGKKITPALAKDERFKTFVQVIFPSLAPTMKQLSTADWPQVIDIETDSPKLNLLVTSDRIVNQQNKVTGFIKIINDHTREQNILESKSDFITTTAHQLRTPLNAINWALESLQTSVQEPAARETIQQGLALSQRALKIINDLLDVAQLEGGKYNFTFSEIDLDNLIKTIVNDAQPIAKELGIKLNYSGYGRPATVYGDANRLGVAISALIDNALKYNTKDGAVNVELRQQSPDFVLVKISDTGVGIPIEEQKKIFSKFYRGESAKRIDPNSSGLGLYITKNIIERHGGKIWVESVPQRGTTFYFTIPTNKNLVPSQ